MAKRSSIPPQRDGYYWATHRKYRWRAVVLLALNGQKHRRAFTARQSSSFDPWAFTSWSARIRER